SLIRDAIAEPINESRPAREEGLIARNGAYAKRCGVLPPPRRRSAMQYKVAGIDIHKKVLMVVVASVADEVKDVAAAALDFQCRRFGTGAEERKHLVSWLQSLQVQEVVMESTAQYWKPVWLELEPHFPKLHLAQAQSNAAPKGRKND